MRLRELGSELSPVMEVSSFPVPSGKLVSCVYRFKLDDENIDITNTLADKNILTTFITENPDCQYGVDGIEFDFNGDLLVGNFGDDRGTDLGGCSERLDRQKENASRYGEGYNNFPGRGLLFRIRVWKF